MEVHPWIPATTIPKFVAFANANPGKLINRYRLASNPAGFAIGGEKGVP